MTWEVHVDLALRARAPPHVWGRADAARAEHAHEQALGGRRPAEARPSAVRGVPNLYRAPALPDGWRALYVIGTDAFMPRRVLIVWLGAHKEYDRLLGY